MLLRISSRDLRVSPNTALATAGEREFRENELERH